MIVRKRVILQASTITVSMYTCLFEESTIRYNQVHRKLCKAHKKHVHRTRYPQPLALCIYTKASPEGAHAPSALPGAIEDRVIDLEFWWPRRENLNAIVARQL